VILHLEGVKELCFLHAYQTSGRSGGSVIQLVDVSTGTGLVTNHELQEGVALTTPIRFSARPCRPSAGHEPTPGAE
jgi:hypothetical protein